MFLGHIAPIDISDVCGMNLYNIRLGDWDETLLKLAAGDFNVDDLKEKLGDVHEDGGSHLGNISSYHVQKYGFSPDCTIVASTGDNPATILALPLRPQDVIVSAGTSTTFLMSTPEYRPDPATHFMNHPTTAGLYMFMLCYKNGGLAREAVRDALNDKGGPTNFTLPWNAFDEALSKTSPLCQRNSHDSMKLGLYFPKPEIVPNLPSGQWHFLYDKDTKQLIESEEGWLRPEDDARAIVESQMLSLRFRSKDLVSSPGSGLPPQPRRIYLVGGSSRNTAIANVVGQVLGGTEGVYKLDVGENACALGAAYKAVWSLERQANETFEDLIGGRWEESEFVELIAEGYQEATFEKYGEALEGFEMMENILLRKYNRD
jgi:xylulokinase